MFVRSDVPYLSVIVSIAGILLSAAAAAAREEPGPWSLKTDVELSLIRGNSATSTISASTRVRRRIEKHTWTARGSYRRSTADSAVTVDRARVRLEYEYS